MSSTSEQKKYHISYVSYSSIYTFNQCKLRYKYQYLDRLPYVMKVHISTLFGTAMHNALADFYKFSGFTFDELKWLFFKHLMECIQKEKVDYAKNSIGQSIGPIL